MRWNAHEDFQTCSPGCVSARNCLMWNNRVTTASCTGVCWNDPECAGVGHSLGTNSVRLVHLIQWLPIHAGRPRALVLPVVAPTDAARRDAEQGA
jgi:hypothetical protein